MRVSRRRFAGFCLLAASFLIGIAEPATAAAGIPLDVIIFAGVQDLPFFVATEKGFFE
jgi:ABC-type nitrate/sulfonate/bicarbonate transport system substrate-binding protein